MFEKAHVWIEEKSFADVPKNKIYYLLHFEASVVEVLTKINQTTTKEMGSFPTPHKPSNNIATHVKES